MQTHEDRDPRDFMQLLQQRADAMERRGLSQITAGKPGEQILEEWESNGVHVRHMPDDQQKILRVSIGGGEIAPVELNYCVFRGPHGACVDLLRKALAALESPQ